MMRALISSAALAAAALLAAPLALPAAAEAKAAVRDWSGTVMATPEGGFRIGNPDAPVKLVEFASMTCPHCAHFAEEAMGPLIANHVKSGKVSFEYRNFVLNGVDVAATLLSRCGGAERFFPLTERMFATQEQWLARVSSLSEAQRDAINAVPEERRLASIAEAAGLTRLATAAGLPEAEAKQCLLDPAGLQQIDHMVEAGAALGITGTPSFLVNGKLVQAHSWAELEPLLKGSGG